MTEGSGVNSIIQWLTTLKKMATSNRDIQGVSNLTLPTAQEQLERVLKPLHLMTSLIGHKNKHFPCLSSLGLIMWIINLLVHFSLDFYEAAHIFGWAWATSIGVFFVSFCSGTYVVTRHTLPWLEDALEILYMDGNFSETLEKSRQVTKKLPWLLPSAAVLAACGQYVCYFIDDATQLQLDQLWLSALLNMFRLISLLHVLYGYILFLAIILFLMYVTGSSMKEFRDGVEGEFKEKDVRLTFREAVQLFEHRSQFLRRSSNSCLFMLVNLVLTTVLSFVINAYNFLFLHRRAIYLWFALVPMIWSVVPLTLAAWATETYHSYVTSVVRSWGEHPESDESESEGEEMDEYHETLKKLRVNRSRSVLIASTNLLKSLQRKRLILRKDRRQSLANQRRLSACSVSPVNAHLSPYNAMRLVDLEAPSEDLNVPFSPTPITAGSQATAEHAKEKKSKFNFKSYVMYLKGLIHGVGFSIGGIVLTWEKVSGLGILLVSVLAVFIQEIVFGSRKSTLLT